MMLITTRVAAVFDESAVLWTSGQNGQQRIESSAGEAREINDRLTQSNDRAVSKDGNKYVHILCIIIYISVCLRARMCVDDMWLHWTRVKGE